MLIANNAKIKHEDTVKYFSNGVQWGEENKIDLQHIVMFKQFMEETFNKQTSSVLKQVKNFVGQKEYFYSFHFYRKGVYSDFIVCNLYVCAI